MKFLLSLVVWALMACAIGFGMLLAVKGSPWLLIISVVGFFAAMGKIGCTSH